MNLVIRAMQGEDVAELAKMEKAAFSVPWSEKAFADLLTHPYNLYLVAVLDGRTVGCAGVTMLGDEADIDKVMVAKDHRGKGIASKLLEKLLECCEERGVTSFTLEVRVSNAPAIHLYRKYGFVSEGVRPRFYEKPVEDAMIMWRRPTITMSAEDYL